LTFSPPETDEQAEASYASPGLVTSGRIDAGRFITRRFRLDEFEAAYDVFACAAGTAALKVVLSR
jgi:threonine dehydrogenase-like Zn-dependent dehydrogenase